MASLTQKRQSRPDELIVGVRRVGRRVVVSPAGEIDIATAPALADAIDAAIDGATAELWVDLTDVGFMDSTGLHVLMDARRRLSGLNRAIAVICPPGGPRRLIELTGLAGALGLSPSRASAHRRS